MLLEQAKAASQQEGALFQRLSSAAKTAADSQAEVSGDHNIIISVGHLSSISTLRPPCISAPYFSSPGTSAGTRHLSSQTSLVTLVKGNWVWSW